MYGIKAERIALLKDIGRTILAMRLREFDALPKRKGPALWELPARSKPTSMPIFTLNRMPCPCPERRGPTANSTRP
jgi:hypothetical protein